MNKEQQIAKYGIEWYEHTRMHNLGKKHEKGKA